jgi:hypothetical protein
MSEEDDRARNRKFAEIFVQLNALRVLLNEFFSVVLVREADPANAVVAVRGHLMETIGRTETMAIAGGGPNVEFRKQHIVKVWASVNAQLDAVEKRVSQLRRGQATH